MQSMTGFGKGSWESEKWKVSTIIRSLNSKGLDISVRAPFLLLTVEPKIKEIIRDKLKRGTVQVIISADPTEPITPVDLSMLEMNVKILKNLVSDVLNLNISDDTLFQFAWKLSEKSETEADSSLEETTLRSVHIALNELIESRTNEGQKLKKDISHRITKIEKLVNKIVEEKNVAISKTKDKILERAKGLELQEKDPLVINELMLLLEKMDIEEEITRLKSHLTRFKSTLETNSEMGKKLEFLAQEMHREITTLGNKIPELSKYTVDIKIEIDRIKQQCANVE